MHPVPYPEEAPVPLQKNVQQSALAVICALVGLVHVYAEHVPYGAPWLLSYWWSVTKTANVCVLLVRVLWEHSAAWMALETFVAVGWIHQ